MRCQQNKSFALGFHPFKDSFLACQARAECPADDGHLLGILECKNALSLNVVFAFSLWDNCLCKAQAFL